jgi:uncharacterized protein (UPF0335 family)
VNPGNNAAQEQLVQYAERIERLLEERQSINDDIGDVKKEAKSTGYDVRTLMEIIKLRKLEPHVRQERAALMETYLAAFGIED